MDTRKLQPVQLSDEQIGLVTELFMSNKDKIIDAHRSMIWSEYSTANRDISLIRMNGNEIKDYVVDHPSMLSVLRGGVDIPVILKTRDVDRYSTELYDISKRCTDIINDPLVAYTSFHIFEADQEAESFEFHTDPVDVFMVVLEGTKNVIIIDDDQECDIEIKAGECLVVPVNMVHRIVNNHASIMLSAGLERYHVAHIELEG